MRTLFTKLFNSPTEEAVDLILQNNPIFQNQTNWRPYGDTESNFSVVENQQASSVAALVEKLTNSIDAMLMKKCYEAGINPKSPEAPKTMHEAVRKFYKYENFDLQTYRNSVAEDIQILADPNSPRMNTSIFIYDNGEGQCPQEFPNTFTSLLAGNKDDIKFVQGKYNMGGAGAIVHCGENRYQLIGSKRFDNTGNFGFTLVRMHPLTKQEEQSKKNTYYEYFYPNGKIPEFPIDELDLKLYRRRFKTGTIIKLYSYDLPSGSRSVISRDLNQSINEYLHNPALPIYIIDRKERYPHDIGLERVMFGLSNRIQDQTSKYVDRQITLDITGNQDTGDIRVYATLFKVRSDEKSVKEFKTTIQNEFFKNNMSVAFSLNGQVHGHYTSEFITRALKWKLFKDYLLIHVDCTNLKLHYRNNLFMASRDRLKYGKEAEVIRELLADRLKKSELSDIYKQRKDSFSAETSDANDILKAFSKDLPLNPEMLKLLKQTFKLEELYKDKKDEKKKKDKKKKEPKDNEPFISQRFPSIFKIDGKPDKHGRVIKTIPLGDDRTIKFSTDVESEYFDRIKDRGELKLYVLKHGSNVIGGGKQPGTPREIEDYFQVVKSNPHDGTIRVNLQPKGDLKVGDELEIRATLSSVISPEGAIETIFYVKIEQIKEEEPKPPKEPDVPQIGLPQLVLVYKDERENVVTWNDLGESGISFDEQEIMATLTNENDELEKIFVNMDSSLLRTYKSRLDGDEALRVADNKYVAQVYFHALFLFSILKQRNYNFSLTDDNRSEKTLEEVLQDLFKSSYGEFLLRFGGTEDLINAIE
ncbi:MAG: hypothetical protein ABSE05_15085 [Syntrophales bacterium]|jgi:hypothetical protein